jgi:ribonucleoside-diphosphate reductase alpha chain
LSNETELFQNDKGIIIKIDRSRDANLTDFGKATLKDRYLGHNESYQDLFARVASTYSDDNLHAQRIYNYISNFGLCLQLLFYQMVEQKEVYLFLVF